MKKVIAALLLALATPLALAAPPEISNVAASQRDGTKLVDITYDAADPDGDTLTIRIEVSDNDGVRYSVPAFTLSGDIGEGIAPGTGKHIVWDAGTDWDGEYSDLMRVMVFAVDAQGYPGLEWGSEVPPGGFLLGQDGGAEGSGPSRHVNIPWSYWLSKYEITAQQYCDFLNTALAAGLVYREGQGSVYTVMGANLIEKMHGSYHLLNIGDNYQIRWNVNNFEVVSNCFNYPIGVTWYGAIAFAHYYGYDLPTEAEWEKAARGPDYDDQDEHQRYAWGNTLSPAYGSYYEYGYSHDGPTPVGYYDGNQTPIGPDMVNGYGLYDMTGNMAEWTLTSGDYEIASYPQQENLLEARHLFWLANDSFFTKGGSYGDSDPAIYMRGGAHMDSGDGFRVARRFGAERPAAVCEIFEDFESWPENGDKTVVADSGTWTMSGYIYLQNEQTNAFSGSKYVSLQSGKLTLPAMSNQVVEIRMKVKNVHSVAHNLYVYSGTSSQYIPVQARSEYTTLSFTPTKDVTSYYISPSSDGGPYLYIDDIEIWTIPRN